MLWNVLKMRRWHHCRRRRFTACKTNVQVTRVFCDDERVRRYTIIMSDYTVTHTPSCWQSYIDPARAHAQPQTGQNNDLWLVLYFSAFARQTAFCYKLTYHKYIIQYNCTKSWPYGAIKCLLFSPLGKTAERAIYFYYYWLDGFKRRGIMVTQGSNLERL